MSRGGGAGLASTTDAAAMTGPLTWCVGWRGARANGRQELFYSLVGPDMRVSYPTLVESMAAMGEEWGILPANVLKHFR